MTNYWTKVLEDDFEDYDGGMGTWQAYPGDFLPIIDTVVFYSGAKSVKFDATITHRSMMKSGLSYVYSQNIEFYYLVSGSSNTNLDHSIITTDNDSNILVPISVNGINKHLMYNSSTGDVVDTGFIFSADVWYKIKIVQNIVEKKYSLWINDVLIIDNVKGYGDPFGYVNTIYFFKTGGFTGMYFWIDKFSIFEMTGVLESVTNALVST
ncbi:MAG: hypothetical protein Q8M94_13955, partial [Ignavibacteria bacterium]|nr:hypothetical protein [Ignavibacteria bacterium]